MCHYSTAYSGNLTTLKLKHTGIWKDLTNEIHVNITTSLQNLLTSSHVIHILAGITSEPHDSHLNQMFLSDKKKLYTVMLCRTKQLLSDITRPTVFRCKISFQRLVISRFQVAIWLKYCLSDVIPQYNQPTNL